MAKFKAMTPEELFMEDQWETFKTTNTGYWFEQVDLTAPNILKNEVIQENALVASGAEYSGSGMVTLFETNVMNIIVKLAEEKGEN